MQPFGEDGAEDGDKQCDIAREELGEHLSRATSCSSFQKCVVCYVNQCDAKLQPCGHDLFCKACAARFRTCPLCRAPLTLRNGRAFLSEDEHIEEGQHERGNASNQGLSASFLWWARKIGIIFWLFIFMGGAVEWVHDVPADGCPPHQESSGWPGLSEEQRRRYLHCLDCSWNGHCNLCTEGTINGGFQCFDSVDELPPVTAGAALGGSTYLVLIILVQVAGGSSECGLIYWCRKHDMLQQKEVVILALALILEVFRMLLVDVFLLQQYFSGMSYRVYRAPVECGAGFLLGNETFIGQDGFQYCPDASPAHQDTDYYIATSKEAFGAKCPTYTTSSALLDYGRTPGPLFLKGGHPRYSHLGWVIGGEFAMFYLFATFVNEVADNMFVMPTTTPYGVFCKAFSVALELFQLGALCPAAIFVHGDCLEYTNPMGVSLNLIRDVVVWFGYFIWGFLLIIAPLILGGVVLMLLFACMSGATCFLLATPIQRCCSREVAARIHEFRLAVWRACDGFVPSTKSNLVFMMVTFAPHMSLVGSAATTAFHVAFIV